MEREKFARSSKNHELRKIEKHFKHPRQDSISAQEASNRLKFREYIGAEIEKLC